MPSAPYVDPRCEWVLRNTLLPFIRVMWRPRLLPTRHFPEGPCFIYGNHSNNFDPFTINLFTPWGHPTSGVMTLERLRKGSVAYLFKGIGLLATRKHVPEPHLIKQIYRLLDAGRSVVIYPEGGRRWDGRPAPWIETTAKLFVKAGVPVYPLLTHGSYVAWPRWARFARPARLRLECLPPLHFDRKTPLSETLARLKAPIDFDENVVPELIRPRFAYRPADGIHRLLYRDPWTGDPLALITRDGTHVINQAGTRKLKMLPDSTLLDERTNTLYTTANLYEQIRALPLEKNPDGALLQGDVELHLEIPPQDLTPQGPVQATLYDDALRLHGPDTTHTIALEDINYTGIERNYKLQLTTSDRMLQLSFIRDGSALQWQDAVQRLLVVGK